MATPYHVRLNSLRALDQHLACVAQEKAVLPRTVEKYRGLRRSLQTWIREVPEVSTAEVRLDGSIASGTALQGADADFTVYTSSTQVVTRGIRSKVANHVTSRLRGCGFSPDSRITNKAVQIEDNRLPFMVYDGSGVLDLDIVFANGSTGGVVCNTRDFHSYPLDSTVCNAVILLKTWGTMQFIKGYLLEALAVHLQQKWERQARTDITTLELLLQLLWLFPRPHVHRFDLDKRIVGAGNIIDRVMAEGLVPNIRFGNILDKGDYEHVANNCAEQWDYLVDQLAQQMIELSTNSKFKRQVVLDSYGACQVSKVVHPDWYTAWYRILSKRLGYEAVQRLRSGYGRHEW